MNFLFHFYARVISLSVSDVVSACLCLSCVRAESEKSLFAQNTNAVHGRAQRALKRLRQLQLRLLPPPRLHLRPPRRVRRKPPPSLPVSTLVRALPTIRPLPLPFQAHLWRRLLLRSRQRRLDRALMPPRRGCANRARRRRRAPHRPHRRPPAELIFLVWRIKK